MQNTTPYSYHPSQPAPQAPPAPLDNRYHQFGPTGQPRYQEMDQRQWNVQGPMPGNGNFQIPRIDHLGEQFANMNFAVQPVNNIPPVVPNPVHAPHNQHFQFQPAPANARQPVQNPMMDHALSYYYPGQRIQPPPQNIYMAPRQPQPHHHQQQPQYQPPQAHPSPARRLIRLVPYEFEPAPSEKINLAAISKEAAWKELDKLSLTAGELHINGYVVFFNETAVIADRNVVSEAKMPTIRCGRCRGLFSSKGPCRFHIDHHTKSCCGRKRLGCQSYPEHVHAKMSRDELRNFRCTERSAGEDDARNTNIFALDTEMVYTTNGLEAARVTIVDRSAATVLDIFIKPSGRVVDYNTCYSGIKEGDLDNGVTLEEARAQLMSEINENTILVGHHLANDLKALRLIHKKIVDTAVLFKVNDKFPSLKKLAAEHLKKVIHADVNGHDPIEDAKTSLEIVQEKWGLLLFNVSRRPPRIG